MEDLSRLIQFICEHRKTIFGLIYIVSIGLFVWHFLKFKMPMDLVLQLKYEDIKKRLENLQKWEEYKGLWIQGKEAFSGGPLSMMFEWGSGYDFAWGVLRTIRRELVRTADLIDFRISLGGCYDQLAYMREKDKQVLKTQLDKCKRELENRKGGEISEEVRAELLEVVVRLDEAQTNFWLKLNDYSIRMYRFGWILLLVLAATLLFIKELRMIALLGALGGLLGGLIRSESEGVKEAHIGTFYLRRVHSLLSPLLGASGAIGVYFLVKSNILVLLPELKATENIWYYYSIAFVSGFSERVLLSSVEMVAKKFEPAGRSEKQEEEENGDSSKGLGNTKKQNDKGAKSPKIEPTVSSTKGKAKMPTTD